ncbi:carbohydrate ABC transporter permease [Mycetocola sp.]|uniref:carbohydrate ABC transporter permease n=1 Tax=Mycetocola sp. TaxID=1871042 RepID=UPI0039891912
MTVITPRGARRGLGTFGWHTVLIVVAAAQLFPLFWAVVTSLKPPGEIYSPTLLAENPTLENYAYALTRFPLGAQLFNTFVMAMGIAIGQLVVAVLAAYALVYFAPKWRSIVYVLFAATLAIPAQTLIIPQFLITAELEWLNTPQGLILPQIAGSALALLLLHRHIKTLPGSQLDAARLDGARSWDTFIHVVLPQLRPALGAVFILGFISGWNEYLWPLLVASDPTNTVVQIGLQQFMTAEGNNFGGLLAASALSTIPILLVYAVASRQITDAFMKANEA